VPADPESRWLAAVALGGQGRYAAAATLLDRLTREADPVRAALAASTLASHRRQLGGHAAARALDAAAVRRLAGRDAREAWSDALLGLAADALGLGRTGEARRLLAAAERRGEAGWRAAIRLSWVSAEIDLGDGRADRAVPHAEKAMELASGASSARHRIKSGLILGAALAAGGDRESARPVLADAGRAASGAGLLPLVWPCALLLADLEPELAAEHRRQARAALHGVLRRSDPAGRRIARSSPWVPDPDRLTG
jgi:tetratricopeptide (TPR) repeat protein